MRERFDTEQRHVRPTALSSRLVRLTGTLRVVDLRRDRTLDALGLDDQINTGRAAGVWSACHVLIDLIAEWFGERCDGLVYRSRTTPERSANLAFFAHAPVQAQDLGSIREQDALLIDCITRDGFAIQGWR